MNKQQITQVQTQIEEVKKLNIPELLAKAYPDQTELNSIQINKMSVSEFSSLSSKFFIQLEKELKTENRLILPFVFVTPEYGQSNLDQMISNFISEVNSLQFARAENSLLWLAQYQLCNSFYDKSKIKFHTEELFDLKKTQDDLSLLKENYSQLKNQYNKLLKDLTLQKNQLFDLFTQKQTEFQQLSNILQTANNTNNQIQGLLISSSDAANKVSVNLEQVDKAKKQVESTSNDISINYSQFKIDFDTLIKELEDIKKVYKELYMDFSDKLKFVEEKHEYFIDRNNYLDNLLEREVGASLFETFKQRKKELENPIKWWRIAVVFMSILIFIVILAIFTNLFGYFGNLNSSLNWESLVGNTLKSLPFFFLLYYTIAQYNKERNFQEEYAFKSAAALTIKAYSDILKDDKNKDELILKAVMGVYRSPISQKTKEAKDVNTIIDMIYEFNNNIKEVIKKN